jgi:hypothetical protein
MEPIALPDPIEIEGDEDNANQLAALMGEIDAILEETDTPSTAEMKKSDAAAEAAADAVEVLRPALKGTKSDQPS